MKQKSIVTSNVFAQKKVVKDPAMRLVADSRNIPLLKRQFKYFRKQIFYSHQAMDNEQLNTINNSSVASYQEDFSHKRITVKK